MIYNLDNYNIQLYNEFLQNLKNHNIDFNEYVCIKDNRFYLETAEYPFILDYKPASKTIQMFLITKTQGVNSQDELKYLRKKLSNTKDNLEFCKNDAYEYFLNKKSDYFYFINIPNKERAELLSKDLGRLYYFGNYLGKFKVYLTDNQYTSNFINVDDILAAGSDLFQIEMHLNYMIFKQNVRLKKFSQTPYRENGKTVMPKYVADFFKSNTAVTASNDLKTKA